jgi:serine/threonine protein kinase
VPHEPRYHKGDKIGDRYLVHQALAGGMGEVYLCLDLQDKVPVALKTIQEQYLTDAGARALFEREATTWVKLEHHSNIVRCFYMNKLDNRPFLFLEWVANDDGRGADLRDWLLRRTAPEPRLALQFAIDICRGLAHADQKCPGVVHCDLKPENILVAQGQLAKVTDFGLAKVLKELRPKPLDWANFTGSRRQVSAAGGTPPYMAPEQWRGDTLDARTDVYAVGCLLYELLAGRWPFDGNTGDDQRRHHLGSPPPPIPLPRSESLVELLNPVLARCMAKDRNERFASLRRLSCLIRSPKSTSHAGAPRPAPSLRPAH